MKRKLIRLAALSGLLSAVLAVSAGAGNAELAAVYSGECGASEREPVTWTLDTASGVLTISGSGEMENNVSWFSHDGKIKRVVIENGVTSVGSYAFSGLPLLTGVTIAPSVKQIGEGAFSDCANLSTVTLNKGVTMLGKNSFAGCVRLKSVSLPESVELIDRDAFHGCEALETVTFGKNLTSMEDSAFSECHRLNNVTLPAGLERIGEQAFSSCYQLSSMTIPDSVTHLGKAALIDCYQLNTLTIGSGISVIPQGLFSGCDALTTLVLPDTITVFEDFGGSQEGKRTIHVYYAGTSARWASMKGGGKAYLNEFAAGIHYGSTGPNHPGTVEPLSFAADMPTFGASIPLTITGGGRKTAFFFAAFYDDDNRFLDANSTQAELFPGVESVFVPVYQTFTPLVRVFALDDAYRPVFPASEQRQTTGDALPAKYTAILSEPDPNDRDALIDALSEQEAKEFVRRFTGWLN